MTEKINFQNIIEQFRASTDPIALMRQFIVQSGGYWTDPEDTTLFEIHFLGIAGAGYGASDAIKNWLDNAQSTNAVDMAA